jgi:sigma-B regulation protein RsbU (phosphoserine phosphatase)
MDTQQPFLEKDIKASAQGLWAPGWLQEEGFRTQAAVPLITEGRSVGALVIDTRQPRKLGGNATRLLQLMANQAAIAVEKARLHREEVKSQALEKEMEVGQQIQLSLLPETPSTVPGWEFATYYSAARQVGGDFYDIFELPGKPRRLGMIIADVMGKGVPAALFMALSRTIIRTTALNGRSPASTLAWANELIQKNNRADLFLTAFYARLDTSSGRLAYACAGHNRPLWLKASSGVIQELTARGIIMAAFDKIDLEEREIEVAPGDSLVFYTDGVTEAMNAHREPFGEKQLEAVVKASAGAPAQQVVDAVVQAVEAHAGDTAQSDDITLFVVRRCPSGAF